MFAEPGRCVLSVRRAPCRPWPGADAPSEAAAAGGAGGARRLVKGRLVIYGEGPRSTGMESRKLISATDTQYSGTLLTSLNEQRINGVFCDVTVIVEDKKFRAHRNILSASSTYFHQLFSVAGQVVELSFVKAEVFAEILNYIYSAKIVRVRSDLLEELIKSGKLLGVKFISDLGVPLSQMKSMSGAVKDNSVEASPSDTDQKSADNEKSATGQPLKYVLNKDGVISAVPVITESFSMSSEELKESKNSEDCKDKGGNSDDDDVIFCSELVPPKPRVTNNTEMARHRTSPDMVELSNQQTTSNISAQAPFIPNTKSPNSLPLASVTPSQTNSLSVNRSSPSLTQVSGASLGSSQNHMMPNSMLLNQHQLNFSPSSISSLPQKHFPTTMNMLVHQQTSNNAFSNKPVIISDSSCASSPDSFTSSFNHRAHVDSAGAFDGPVVQKPQMASFTRERTSKPGELKIKIADVNPGNKDTSVGAGSQHIMDGKKIITLDTTSEIEGLSTGCKVYANIGEDTYDIVIPIKDDPDDGAVELPRSIDGSPNSKRMKLKHEDHYELIVDGKVYYICIVCKRSYVCLTSLRRHFNVHSWEKKYPCHYCEKVFPLAEYRTKHEIHHTGERRYQCLTCGHAFINYQVMASHMRSVHSQDPSGDSKLYRLHPCRSLQIRQYAYISNMHPPTSAPVTNDPIVYNVDDDKDGTASEETESNPSTKHMRWDDVFVQQPAPPPMFKQSPTEGSTEFEFVIPESY